jgi:hypothetical protein
MTWTTQAYCTLTDVKTLLDPTLGTQDDTFLQTLIVQAQADLDNEIGFSFQQNGTTQSPVTYYYDGEGKPELWIDDLVSLTSVIETYTVTYMAASGIWQTGTTQTYDITADVIVKPNNYAQLGVPGHKLVRNSGYEFKEGVQNYAVTGVFGQPYIAGQTYPGVPNDLSRACARLVVHYYKMRDTAYADMVQEQGNVRIHYSKDWPDDVKRVVAKYQHSPFFSRAH